jgi:hypothetical protein
MDESVMRTLVDRYVAAYNAFDVTGMMAVVHADVEFRNVAGGEVTASASGAAEFQQMAEQSRALFASRRQEITSYELKDDLAQVGIRYEGVLAVDLPNGMKSGDTLRLDGRSEFGFRDRRIDRITDYS